MRSSRRASGVSWSPPTTRPTRPRGGGSDPARRRHRGPDDRRRGVARGAPHQPALPEVRADRPALRALQVRDELDGKVATPGATRSGSRARQPKLVAPLAGRRRRRSRSGSARPSRTTRCSPRAIEGVTRQPTRVVFDSEARLPLDSNLVRTAPEVPLVCLLARRRPRPRRGLRAAGADHRGAPARTERERVIDGLDELGARGVQSLLLEGGPRLAGSFLDAGEIDEVRLFVAPIADRRPRRARPVRGRGRRHDRRRRAGADVE